MLSIGKCVLIPGNILKLLYIIRQTIIFNSVYTDTRTTLSYEFKLLKNQIRTLLFLTILLL